MVILLDFFEDCINIHCVTAQFQNFVLTNIFLSFPEKSVS